MADVTAGMITGKETVEFLTFPHEDPPPGCLSVDIALCGICGTDIASFRSGHLHQPAVCGHEWVGTVGDVGPDGRRVRPRGPGGHRRAPGVRLLSGVHQRTLGALPDGVVRGAGVGIRSPHRTVASLPASPWPQRGCSTRTPA